MSNTARPARGGGRESLIQAAIGVVGESGLATATVRRIAERAGVNNTLITHYFGSRDALLIAATEAALAEQLELVDVSIELILEPTGRQAHVEATTRYAEVQAFQYQMVLAGRHNAEIAATVAALYDACIDRMRQSLRAHKLPDTEPFARALFALMDGLILQQISVATPEEIRAALDAIGDFLRKHPS
ncbi:MAG TPA: TetR family transcriptional regulator [Pseudolysinimonas sp.]|nr:TetR family transcriptional regulator [Pseudolysinimonas sp.]